MVDIHIKQGVTDTVKAPETAMETSIHPKTGQRGRWFVKTGQPVQVWDPKTRKLRWMQFSEVEPIRAYDDATFMLVNDGHMTERDFEEVRQEMFERRQARRINRPTLAPRNDVIAQACKEVMFQEGGTVTVGDVTFERPKKGLLIPRDAEWAIAMAEESRTGWDTKLKPGAVRRRFHA